MIFKILRGVRQSAPNAASLNGWIFWYSESRLRYPSIYLYRFSMYHSLISSKRSIDKHLSDYYPNQSMLHNPANPKKICHTAMHGLWSNLNFNRAFGHSKWMSSQSNGPLRNCKLNYLSSSRSDPIERKEMKQKQLLDGFWKYLSQKPLVKLLFLA